MEKILKSPHRTVSIGNAIDETANWRNVMGPFMGEHLLRGFFIPIQDVRDIAEMNNVEGMRGYFCLKVPGDLSSISFIVVPVRDNGTDKLQKDDTDHHYGDHHHHHGSDHHHTDNEGDSTIYDLTRPCPDFCDQLSPLYGPPVIVKSS